jgi:glycosyl hydrolase family 114
MISWAYERMLADLAHADGLAIGLKNDPDQAEQLLPSFDFSVDERRFVYQERDELVPLIKADKPVFEAEYNLQTSQSCTQGATIGYSSMRKNLAFDAPRWPCAVGEES